MISANSRMPAIHTELGLISLGYLVSVMINVYQGLTASVYVVCLGLIRPGYIPYLLILLAAIQDGPGIYRVPRFIAFAVLTCFLIVVLMVRTQHFLRLARELMVPRYLFVVFIALFAVVYALVVSFIVDAYSANAFVSSSRPWYLVGITNLVMILAAFLATLFLAEDKQVKSALTTVALVSLAYLLFVAIVQMLTDPTVLHSDYLRQSNAFRYGSQMSGSNPLGLARIASAMETPNAFCLSVAFLFMLVFIGTQDNKNSLILPISMSLVGLFVGFITLSKAQLAYFLVASLLCFLLTKNYRFRLIGYLGILVGLVVLLYFGNVMMDTFAQMFRVRDLTSTTRYILWEAVVERMSFLDWILGRGYSHWEEIFADVYRYKAVTAPHNYLMYVLGTFGVLGIFVYTQLFMLLARRYQQLRRNNTRVAQVAVMLVLFIFVKDLVTTSYVFNTSPLVYLLWLCVGLLCVASTADNGSARVTSTATRVASSHRMGGKVAVEPEISGAFVQDAKKAFAREVQPIEKSNFTELYDLASEPEIAARLAQAAQQASATAPATEITDFPGPYPLPRQGFEAAAQDINGIEARQPEELTEKATTISLDALERTLAALQPEISHGSKLEIRYTEQHRETSDTSDTSDRLFRIIS